MVDARVLEVASPFGRMSPPCGEGEWEHPPASKCRRRGPETRCECDARFATMVGWGSGAFKVACMHVRLRCRLVTFRRIVGAGWWGTWPAVPNAAPKSMSIRLSEIAA